MKQDAADKLNDLIDECIGDLCDDNAEHGAESLVELAIIWARAGMPQSSFADMRSHIVNSAIERVGSASFIQYKLKLAEQSLNRTRSHTRGHSIIIN